MTEEVGAQSSKPYSSDDSIHLFLAYFGIFSLIPFFMFRDKRQDPQKEYVYWHARQGLAFAIAVFLGFIVLGILMFVVALVTAGIGAMVGMCLWPVVMILLLVVNIICWVKAFKGVKWAIPGVSKLAEMFK